MVTVRGGNVFAMVAMKDVVASLKSAKTLKTNAQALSAQRKVQAHHAGNLLSATIDNRYARNKAIPPRCDALRGSGIGQPLATNSSHWY